MNYRSIDSQLWQDVVVALQTTIDLVENHMHSEGLLREAKATLAKAKAIDEHEN